MSNVKIQQWKEKMSHLEGIIFSERDFAESKRLLIDLHATVHASVMTSNGEETLDDDLWQDMDEVCFRTLANGERVTIAWSIYHIARIEDMTMNILVNGGSQVFFEGNWKDRLNCPIVDTGNALTTKEMENLSNKLNWTEIRNYRNMVGKRTSAIIHELQFSDLSRTIQKSELQRIFDEGGVKEDTL